MSAMPPMTPPTMVPTGVLFLLWEPMTGTAVEENDEDEPCCVGVAVPVLIPLGMTLGVEVSAAVSVAVTASVSVIRDVPPPARIRVCEAPASVVATRSM